MRNKIISLLLITSSFFLVGCNETTTKDTTPKQTPTVTSTNSENFQTPFILTEETLYPSSFILDNNTLVFPNPDDNNKISLINTPLPTNHIENKDITSFAEYSTYTISKANGLYYFADDSNGDCLASIDMSTKNYKKLSNTKVTNLIATNSYLFYINKGDYKKLSSFEISTGKEFLLSNDRVGKFIINGDNIIYQNVSDSSKLYTVKKDGTNNKKLADFSVESFIIYNNMILAINSSDNNNLYSIDSATLNYNRLKIMNGENLKIFNNKIYYLDLNDGKYLNSLAVDLDKNTATSTLIYKEGVNDYFPSDNSIFIERSVNINNTYVYILNNAK